MWYIENSDRQSRFFRSTSCDPTNCTQFAFAKVMKVRTIIPSITSLLVVCVLRCSAISLGTEPPMVIPVCIRHVTIEDDFCWLKRKVWQEVTTPPCFDKSERDVAPADFDKIHDGKGDKRNGPPWLDGLISEMVRASADFPAACRPDPDIHRIALDIAQALPEQTVYIEHRLMFVEVASGLGINSIYHKDFEPTQKALAAMGLSLE